MGLQYDCAKLISMVFERRPIWDYTDPNYHNREHRKLLWLEICNELNANLDDVYRRWKSLKDTFVREYKKQKLFGKKNKWIYYNDLMFLKDRFAYEQETVNHQNEHDYFGVFDTGSLIEAGDSADNTDQENRSTHRPVKKLKTKGRSGNSGPAAAANCTCGLSSSLDPDYFFLMSLLPYMKSIKTERKMDIRAKLQQVFHEEQQLQLESLQYQCSSTSSIVAAPSPDDEETGENALCNFINSFTVK